MDKIEKKETRGRPTKPIELHKKYDAPKNSITLLPETKQRVEELRKKLAQERGGADRTYTYNMTIQYLLDNQK